MGIRKIVILAHQWEPFYKDEFRRAARLARELCMAIEPLFETGDERFGVSKAEVKVPDAELYTDNPNHPDEYDPQSTDEINDGNNYCLTLRVPAYCVVAPPFTALLCVT